MTPDRRAQFATSDADDLLAGAQGVLVVPPPAPAATDGADGADGAAARAPGGFSVDLEVYMEDGRLQTMPMPK